MPADPRRGPVCPKPTRLCLTFASRRENERAFAPGNYPKNPSLFSEKGRFKRLLKIADSEPPRVRAIMGAIEEQIEEKRAALTRLHAALYILESSQIVLL